MGSQVRVLYRAPEKRLISSEIGCFFNFLAKLTLDHFCYLEVFCGKVREKCGKSAGKLREKSETTRRSQERTAGILIVEAAEKRLQGRAERFARSLRGIVCQHLLVAVQVYLFGHAFVTVTCEVLHQREVDAGLDELGHVGVAHYISSVLDSLTFAAYRTRFAANDIAYMTSQLGDVELSSRLQESRAYWWLL